MVNTLAFQNIPGLYMRTDFIDCLTRFKAWEFHPDLEIMCGKNQRDKIKKMKSTG